MRSPDGVHELRIGASSQFDTRVYGGDSTAPSSFDVRTARIELNAKLFRYFSIRFQAALEDTPYIRNAYFDIGPWDELHLRVGQYKVPFSSSWVTQDMEENFLERASAEPIYPFLDRGLTLWGTLSKTLTYNAGVFNGTGVDADAPRGDIDSKKEWVGRLFAQPFRTLGFVPLSGLYVVSEGTYEAASVPTRRFETRGLSAPTFESQIWRWRTEQTLGTNGRDTDQTSAEIRQKYRYGWELHYILGPVTLSSEWLAIHYNDISVFHDFYQGSKQVRRDPVSRTSGTVRSLATWVSWYVTGEQKKLNNWGWEQPMPERPLGLDGGGIGAWEVLGRFSVTDSSAHLFDSVPVKGYAPRALQGVQGAAPGEGASVTTSVLEGVSRAYEITAGVNWTLNYALRLQLNYTYLWSPRFQTGKEGIGSGAASELYDAAAKGRLIRSEHELGLRFALRI